MSDPAKNEEIEDVLSSIRRLVSESGGLKDETCDQQEVPNASQSFEHDPVPGGDGDAPVDRLVLTPSLRVADDEEEAAGSVGNADAGASQGLAVNQGDGSESDEKHEEDTSDAADVDAGDEDYIRESDGRHGQDYEPEVNLSVEESSAIEDHGNEPEDGEDAVVADSRDDEAPVDLQGDEQAAHEDATETDQTRETLKDRIEQLETAVLRSQSDWEDDMDGGGDNAPQPVETLQWEDHSDDEVRDVARESFRSGAPFEGADSQKASEEEDSSGEFDFMGSDDEAVLDEEALREMVADIVRQELQGALGERITRNVRKLVRREIHRALMAQELD